MCDRRWQLGLSWQESHPAKRPLIEKVDVRTAIGKTEANTKMPVTRSLSRSHSELTAHAQVRQQGVAIVKYPPQVLSAPPDVDDPMTSHRRLEISPPCEMTTNGPVMKDGDFADLPTDCVLQQATPYYLHLG